MADTVVGKTLFPVLVLELLPVSDSVMLSVIVLALNGISGLIVCFVI
jgi:hypothetical protein